MAKDPDISVVICTRNRAAKLNTVLEAFARIETDRSWELLMIDNASTDDTFATLQAADTLGGRMQVHKCERIGLGAARAFAWPLAKGRIVAFTDDDCYPAPDYIDAISRVFAEHPDVDLVGGRIMLFDPDDVRMAIDERTEPVEYPPHVFVDTGAFHGANISVRKTALARAGGFDPELGAGTAFPCEDIDMVAAVLWSGGKARFDPRPVVFHHHGRKKADLTKLWMSYDAGRGAYYAKFLLRADSRASYLRGWGRRLLKRKRLGEIRQFGRELQFGYKYAIAKRRFGFVALGIVPALFTFLIVAGLVTAKFTLLRIIPQPRP
jgi:glycosyltransferase involved in cell wall biosynthesis